MLFSVKFEFTSSVLLCSALLTLESEGGSRISFSLSRKDGGYTCGGDSGGPAVADRDGDGTWVLYGLTSYGAGAEGFECGKKTHTGFTDVSAFTDIIMSLIEQNP